MFRHHKQRYRKSLSTLLMVWLLLFSIVPLAFITGYSLVKYEKAIESELYHRLMANRREIEWTLREYNNYLTKDARRIATNKVLVSYLKDKKYELLREWIQEWVKFSSLIHKIELFGSKGELLSTVYRDSDGNIKEINYRAPRPIYMSDAFIKSMGRKEDISVVDIRKGVALDLSAFSKILTEEGELLGYIQKVIRLDKEFLKEIGERLNLQITVLKENIEGAFASHRHLLAYDNNFFINKIARNKANPFEINILGKPFEFMAWPVKWGDDQVIVSIGASKQSAKEVLKNVKYAFFAVIGAIIMLLVGLSFIISRMLLRPLLELVNAIQVMDPNKELVQLPVHSNSEVGLLTESFNNMFKRIHQSQRELRDSIGELERANIEIKETQSKSVHASKMASLGQLVAGIAHELNNPIGFIHSNVYHLKDYYDKLVRIVKKSERDPKNFTQIKEENEWDYIIKDMPKLIKSCEEGVRRSRDIILGLRNFSRLEEAIFKEADLHQGIEDTLRLLTGELKNRVKVKKKFGKIPEIRCYPSQLNQVFMNIFSNAAQAIDGKGIIEVQTKKVKANVEIVIKDSGCGMPPETMDKIFDPFFTTKKPGAGTGLGLSISYGIVEKHGGHIHVKSGIDQGTQFTIILPIHGPSDNPNSLNT